MHLSNHFPRNPVFRHIGSGKSAQFPSQQLDFNDDLLSVGIRYFVLLAFRIFG